MKKKRKKSFIVFYFEKKSALFHWRTIILFIKIATQTYFIGINHPSSTRRTHVNIKINRSN